MTQRRALVLTVLAASLLAASSAGFAQSPYPDKPITMIVPFPPGGNGTIIVIGLSG